MKKIPKGSCALLKSVDKTLAGTLVAAALMGGASFSMQASEVTGGG